MHCNEKTQCIIKLKLFQNNELLKRKEAFLEIVSKEPDIVFKDLKLGSFHTNFNFIIKEINTPIIIKVSIQTPPGGRIYGDLSLCTFEYIGK